MTNKIRHKIYTPPHNFLSFAPFISVKIFLNGLKLMKKVNVKVKESRCRSGQALRVPATFETG